MRIADVRRRIAATVVVAKDGRRVTTVVAMDDEIEWLGTKEAARRLGLTTRTLYRLINEGQIPAYKFGRVIRLQAREVDAFIEAARIRPGDLEHLYPHPDDHLDELDS